MKLPSDAVVQAWTALVRAHTLVMGKVEGALKAAGLPPLEWYDVLWELERAGAMRPRELQARLLLAQSNLSRLIDRMAAADMVERESCAEDRRGQLVGVTEAGRDMRRRMWPVYADAVAAAIGTRLTEAEAAQLGELLRRLAVAGGDGA